MGAPRELPDTYQAFVARYPQLARAWELAGQAGLEGPLDPKTARLVKLGISMGALREGAVHSGVRKALEAGVERAAIEQLVAMVAGSLGFAAAAAVYTWVQDVLTEGP
jgi:alkylhydroperoxidase/carboxymuconolactone decarboxylase family protein YurZ